MQLVKSQQKFFDRIASTTTNYFVTGKPGVGKSVLINALVDAFPNKYTLAAPTGLAALNIGGRTLNSIFRIPIFEGIIEPDYNQFSNDDQVIKMIRFNIKHLIIDEISMVRADMLDYIDRLLKYCKKNDLPFGGIQVIIVGDFFQLPPVAKPFELGQLNANNYKTPFAFSAKIFESANFETLELTEVLRQKEIQFIKILHAARTGDITIAQCGKLNKNVRSADDLRITLCGINRDAATINANHLKNLPGETVEFTGVKYGEWPALPVEELLQFKIGAQVMVKMNGADREQNDRDGLFQSKVVNGTMGRVVSFMDGNTKVESGNVTAINIQLDSGEEILIHRRTWQRKIKELIDGEWNERVVASYEQIPLTLAWAISIHKSQGQSFDKVTIDPRKMFANGQLYVALSRCRTLEGINFTSVVNTSKFKADNNVKQFYKQLKNAKN